jgi:hypothetical protein
VVTVRVKNGAEVARIEWGGASSPPQRDNLSGSRLARDVDLGLLSFANSAACPPSSYRNVFLFIEVNQNCIR